MDRKQRNTKSHPNNDSDNNDQDSDTEYLNEEWLTEYEEFQEVVFKPTKCTMNNQKTNYRKKLKPLKNIRIAVHKKHQFKINCQN